MKLISLASANLAEAVAPPNRLHGNRLLHASYLPLANLRRRWCCCCTRINCTGQLLLNVARLWQCISAMRHSAVRHAYWAADAVGVAIEPLIEWKITPFLFPSCPPHPPASLSLSPLFIILLVQQETTTALFFTPLFFLCATVFLILKPVLCFSSTIFNVKIL